MDTKAYPEIDFRMPEDQDCKVRKVFELTVPFDGLSSVMESAMACVVVTAKWVDGVGVLKITHQSRHVEVQRILGDLTKDRLEGASSFSDAVVQATAHVRAFEGRARERFEEHFKGRT